MARMHPTAIVDPSARLGEDVQVGPHSIIEADVVIGPGCVLRENVIVRRYTTLGSGNFVDAFSVLGGEPQDLKFDPATVSYLKIGDNNVFREGVTISRATGEGNVTLVGNKTYWMAGAHAGHNAVICDEAILINGAAVAGHATIGRKAILSSHVVVHQFCWVGDMAMSRGNAGTSTHIPPYCIFVDINRIAGLNAVGLRRSPDITESDRAQIKEAYRLLYRSGLTPRTALEKMDACADWGKPAGVFRDFIRKAVTAAKPFNRPISPSRASREHVD